MKDYKVNMMNYKEGYKCYVVISAESSEEAFREAQIRFSANRILTPVLTVEDAAIEEKKREYALEIENLESQIQQMENEIASMKAFISGHSVQPTKKKKGGKVHIETDFYPMIEECNQQLKEELEMDPIDKDQVSYIRNMLDVLERYKYGFDVESFEDWRQVVHEISEATDGNYHVSNEGLYISCPEW